ncbi:hypothetical protein [Marinifilum fragile]|uniref:hypothetical protein n=1 Tax=Marinifilum fragile TaxID=570161 RepID=UPI002AA61F70|nr:hypothetical protein [Marinifilum fragile]
MKNLLLSCLFITAILFSACKNEKQSNSIDIPDGNEKIKVTELIDGNTYTYIKGNNENSEIWVAIRKQPIEIGKTYFYKNALPMKDFHSKELNKTFPLIYFLNSISSEPSGKADPHSKSQMKKPSAVKVEVDIKASDDFTNIQNIFKNKDELVNSVIKVKGKVTKFNENILNRNWIHIQDGTEHNGNFDLTITSNQTVSIGEIVEFKGVLITDKDFGAGYKYDVLLENAERLNNTKSQ